MVFENSFIVFEYAKTGALHVHAVRLRKERHGKM